MTLTSIVAPVGETFRSALKFHANIQGERDENLLSHAKVDYNQLVAWENGSGKLIDSCTLISVLEKLPIKLEESWANSILRLAGYPGQFAHFTFCRIDGVSYDKVKAFNTERLLMWALHKALNVTDTTMEGPAGDEEHQRRYLDPEEYQQLTDFFEVYISELIGAFSIFRFSPASLKAIDTYNSVQLLDPSWLYAVQKIIRIAENQGMLLKQARERVYYIRDEISMNVERKTHHQLQNKYGEKDIENTVNLIVEELRSNERVNHPTFLEQTLIKILESSTRGKTTHDLESIFSHSRDKSSRVRNAIHILNEKYLAPFGYRINNSTVYKLERNQK